MCQISHCFIDIFTLYVAKTCCSLCHYTGIYNYTLFNYVFVHICMKCISCIYLAIEYRPKPLPHVIPHAQNHWPGGYIDNILH